MISIWELHGSATLLIPWVISLPGFRIDQEEVVWRSLEDRHHWRDEATQDDQHERYEKEHSRRQHQAAT